jgi:hypothetical protein
MGSPSRPTVVSKPLRQLAIPLGPPASYAMTAADRDIAVRRLARLLMEAAGMGLEEIGDDER